MSEHSIPPPIPADDRDTRIVQLTSLFFAAGVCFGLLTRGVAHRETAAVDRGLQPRARLRKGNLVRKAAERVGPLGKWWVYVPAAGITAAYVIAAGERSGKEHVRRTRRAGAAAIVSAALVAASVNEVVDDVLPQPPAPPGRPTPNHPVFPSGHTFGTASVTLTAAYVLTREELAAPGVAYSLALAIPLISASARMIEEKHWLSDIVGGLLAAVVVASLPLAAYETISREIAE